MRFQLNTHFIFALAIGFGLIGCSANESGQTDDTTTAADDDFGREADADIDTEADSTASSDVDHETTDSATEDASSDVDTDDSVGVDSTQPDVPTDEDGVPCSGIQYPQKGCPCDPSLGYQECCIKVAYGLACDSFFREWTEFNDCGCDPRCGPTFSLCIAPPPEPEE